MGTSNRPLHKGTPTRRPYDVCGCNPRSARNGSSSTRQDRPTDPLRGMMWDLFQGTMEFRNGGPIRRPFDTDHGPRVLGCVLGTTDLGLQGMDLSSSALETGALDSCTSSRGARRSVQRPWHKGRRNRASDAGNSPFRTRDGLEGGCADLARCFHTHPSTSCTPPASDGPSCKCFTFSGVTPTS